MAYELRDFINELKRRGELVEINDEVDWNLEAAAFESLSGLLGGPAFLFNKVKGVKEGRLLLGHFAASFKKPHRRAAIALGIDPELDRASFFHELFSRGKLLRPVEISTGPCKEVIEIGKDVNLLDYPFVYHAIGDASRYIFMGHVIIKDPDSDWLNMGNYCNAIYSRNRMVTTPYTHSHFVIIYGSKYEARNRSMPVAIVLGPDPAVTLAAVSFIPLGVSELDWAGGIRGSPIEVVKCETSDLLVPANAEMVIEGEIKPYERLPEGPKIENFGFSVGPRQPFYAIRVHCITHRRNPIIPEAMLTRGCNSTGIGDGVRGGSSGLSLLASGIPIKAAAGFTHAGGAMHFLALKKDKSPGFIREMLDKTSVGRLASSPGVVFVDEEVNVFEPTECLETFFSQTNPQRDFQISKETYPMSTLMCDWIEEEDIKKGIAMGTVESSKITVDATTKEKSPMGVNRTQFETLFPDELQKKVVENWRKWGFTEEAKWHKSWEKFKLV